MGNQQNGFQGGCMCGQVKYTCSSAPLDFILCHCRDCQYVSGGSPGAVVVASRSDVTITGDLASHSKAADSGNILTRKFCPTCGTPMFTEPEKLPQILIIKAGSMDDPSKLKPSSEWWTSSAQPWAAMHDDITQFEKNGG